MQVAFSLCGIFNGGKYSRASVPLLAALGVLVLGNPGRATAGGFDRFGQDVSLLFDSAYLIFDVSASNLFTSAHFDSVDGHPELVPKLAADCLASAGKPFGSDTPLCHAPDFEYLQSHLVVAILVFGPRIQLMSDTTKITSHGF
jgi:hypothetical protein